MKEKNKVFRSLSMISQFTIHMLVPICMCSYVGYWLDEKWNTSLGFVIFFFIGALAGGRNVYRLAQKISGGQENMPSKLYGSNQRKREGKTEQEVKGRTVTESQKKNAENK